MAMVYKSAVRNGKRWCNDKASIQTFDEVAGDSGGKGAENVLGGASGFGL